MTDDAASPGQRRVTVSRSFDSTFTKSVITMDLERFLIEFQDHLAPTLDTYEQAIYLFVFRHSRLLGNDEVVVGFKSARRRMALGIGKAGSPMSESRLRHKLSTLQLKGCLRIIGTERTGTRVRILLPSEIPCLVKSVEAVPDTDINTTDFFADPKGRLAILAREQHRCFYCRLALNDQNYVIEHVTSRPDGDGSYRNVVASCRRCNDRKGALEVTDFMRQLYREGFLSESDLTERLDSVARLRSGDLKPSWP